MNTYRKLLAEQRSNVLALFSLRVAL